MLVGLFYVVQNRIADQRFSSFDEIVSLGLLVHKLEKPACGVSVSIHGPEAVDQILQKAVHLTFIFYHKVNVSI